MDPVTLVLAALAAGALTGAGAAASEAVTDAYHGLRDLVLKRLQTRAAGPVALEQYSERPDLWREPLRAELEAVQVDKDGAVLNAASQLLALADPQGESEGKYAVTVTQSQGLQIGDHNVQDNRF